MEAILLRMKIAKNMQAFLMGGWDSISGPSAKGRTRILKLHR